jgi:hypothetical protein
MTEEIQNDNAAEAAEGAETSTEQLAPAANEQFKW